MTDRHAGYIVILEQDFRDDDAAQILSAIQMIKGVAGVKPIVSDASIIIAETRVKRELQQRIIGLLQ